MAGGLHEYTKQLECFRRERHGPAVSEQLVLRQVESKGPELVRGPGTAAHHASGIGEFPREEFWSFLRAFRKDYPARRGVYLSRTHTAAGGRHAIDYRKKAGPRTVGDPSPRRNRPFVLVAHSGARGAAGR